VFTALKWLGAAYLVYLGVRLWRAGGRLDAGPREASASARKMLGHAFAVTALNPKSITFFVAFLPQFLDPARGLLWQLVVMEATFLVLAFSNAMAAALLATRARSVARDERALRLINRVGASVLIGAGAASLGLRTTQG